MTDGDLRLDRRTVLRIGVAGVGVTAAGEQDENGFGPELIEANPDAGFEYPYFLYAPDRYADESPGPVVVQPNNTDEFARHREAARRTVERDPGREIADSLAGASLVPVFPRPRSGEVDGRFTHQLDADTLSVDEGPLARIDLQLLAMVDDARSRLADREYPVSDEVVLDGFSASGNFVNRFAALHSEAVSSVTAGGVNGMPLLPRESAQGRSTDYHVGIGGLESLTGESFDPDAYREVDQLLYMGEFDDSDTLPFGGAFSDTDREAGLREVALDAFGPHMTDDRFPYGRAVSDAFDTGAVSRTYRGFPHTTRPAKVICSGSTS